MKNQAPKVAIVMATYNGVQFLDEQLSSIQRQTFDEWTLFIRDDFSTDATLNLIEQYCLSDPRIKLLTPSRKTLGHCQNFNHLLEHTLKEGFEIIFLSDQDDIWAPEKLEKQLNVHDKADQPILCHTDLSLINQFNETIKPSYIRHMGLNPKSAKSVKHLILENNITGCTVSIDRQILSSALPIPQEMENHDHWLGLIAAASADIRFIDQRLTLYRQHNQNTIGGKNLREISWTYKNFVLIRQRHQKKLTGKIKAIYEYLIRPHEKQNLDDMRVYLNVMSSDSNPIVKVHKLWKLGFRCQTARGYLVVLIST